MGMKKVKISNIKRSQHLKKKKKFTKPKQQDVAQKQQQLQHQKQQQGLTTKQSSNSIKSKKIFGKPAKLKYVKKPNKSGPHKNILSVGTNHKLTEDEDNENIQNKLEMIADEEKYEIEKRKGIKRKHNDGGDDNEDVSDDNGADDEIDEDNDKFANNFEVEYTDLNFVNDAKKKKLINLLPIKTKDGDIIQRTSEVEIKDESILQQNDDETEIDENEEEIDSDEDVIKDGISTDIATLNGNKISTTDLLILREQEISRQKYRIGIICSGILEKPDDKMKNFKALFELMDPLISNNKTDNDNINVSTVPQINLWSIRKIATVSILEVFKDILPEYRIGQLNLKMQTVRKTTMERVTYENALIFQYKKYLQKLEKITSVLSNRTGGSGGEKKPRTLEQIKLGEIGVKCLCELLTEHPYFNFGQNVAQLLVYLLNCNFPQAREKIMSCFQEIFRSDKKFELTLYIIRRLNHLIKSKSNNVHVEVLKCLMSLQIKSINLDSEKENELKQKKMEAHKARLLSMSKKEKKRQKRLQQIDKELQETKAEENKQTKNYKLTEITKMLFTIYFRILKNDPNSKLLSATLEGLAEFAHVINIDFFSDLVEVLNNIMETQELGYREELHCIQTLFTILSGQGEILNIDPLRFYGHLYRNLLLVDAGQNHKDMLIIIKTLTEVLIKRRKNINQPRLLAFIKRILTLSMQLLHNGTISCLGIVKTIMQLTSSLDIILDTDSNFGSGRYNPELDDPEYCNASCTAAYEIALLCRHYHPIVRKMATHIGAGVPASGNGSLPSELGKLTPLQLYEQFDSTEMSFNPPIPPPKPVQPKPAKGRHYFGNSELEGYCRKSLKYKIEPLSNDFIDFYAEIKKSNK